MSAHTLTYAIATIDKNIWNKRIGDSFENLAATHQIDATAQREI